MGPRPSLNKVHVSCTVTVTTIPILVKLVNSLSAVRGTRQWLNERRRSDHAPQHVLKRPQVLRDFAVGVQASLLQGWEVALQALDAVEAAAGAQFVVAVWLAVSGRARTGLQCQGIVSLLLLGIAQDLGFSRKLQLLIFDLQHSSVFRNRQAGALGFRVLRVVMTATTPYMRHSASASCR